MTRETKVASIPDVREDNVTEVLRAIKNVLQVREGQLGDPLDQNVTLRDLTDLSVLVSGGSTLLSGGARVPVTVPGITDDGYDPTTDLTTPAQPTGLTATATFSNVYLSWDGAGYRNHAYTEIWRSGTNVLGEAVLVGTTISSVYADAAQERQTYYYWIRFVSVSGVKGPFNSTAGTAVTTGQDPAEILALLQGQITQTQLYSTLSSRIDLIDAPASVAGSVNARIDVVQSQVNDLLNTPAYDNTDTYAAGAVVTYSGSLYQALQTTTGNLPTNTTYWKKIGDYASLGDAVAAHTTQISSLESGLSQEVTDRTLLATQMRGSYSGTDVSQVTSGLIYSERTARSSADSALSTSISSLSSTVTNNYNTLNASILSEQTTRSTADSALATNIYALQSTASGMDVVKSWNFDSTTEGFSAGGATISWSAGSLRINSSGGDPVLYTPTLNIDGSTAYLVRMRVKRLAGSSWDGKIYYNTSGHGESETYKVQIGDGTVTNEWRVLEWDMSALSDWTASTIINCRIDLGASSSDQFLIDWISISRVAPMPLASQATLQTDYYTKTATDSAIASATTNLVSTTTLNNTLSSYVTTATLTSNYYTKTATDSAISSANSTLSASIAGTYATTVSVSQNYFAKASGQALEAQYTVKIDNNGYVSGFGLASTVVNGEPTSLFMVNADRFAITNPSANRVAVLSIGADFSGNIINTGAAHGFSVGDVVAFQGVSGYTTKYTVTAVYSATQFRINAFSYSTAVSGSSYVAKAAVPFIVDGGVVYMDTAVIKDASISSAKIGSLTADKITTGNLTAAVNVNTGYIYGGVNPAGYTPGSALFGTGYFLGAYGGTNQFFIGSPDKSVLWDGSNLTVRGIVYASAGSFTGSVYAGSGTIGGVSIESGGLRLGTSGVILGGTMTDNWYTTDLVPGLYLGPQGLRMGNGYTGKYFSIDASGNVYAPQFSIVNGNATFSGNLNAASGSFSGTLDAKVTTYAKGASWLFGFTAANSTTYVPSGGMVATSTFTMPCVQGARYVITASNPKWLYYLEWGILSQANNSYAGTVTLTVSVSGFNEGEQALCLLSLPIQTIADIYATNGNYASAYTNAELLGGTRGFSLLESAILRRFCSGVAAGNTLTVRWYLAFNTDAEVGRLTAQWKGAKINHITTNNIATWKVYPGRGSTGNGSDYFGLNVDLFSFQYST